MMRRLIPVILSIFFIFTAAIPVQAYDPTTVHFSITYALARLAGFPDEQASLIADASRSLDENDTTTAYSEILLLKEAARGLAAKDKLEYLQNLPHMTAGQLFHALSANRELVEAKHRERIEALLKPSANDDERRLALVYIGEYIHLVADIVSHPTDPLFGHAPEGTKPDQPEQNIPRLETALKFMLQDLKKYSPNDPPLSAEKEQAVLQEIRKTVEHISEPSRATVNPPSSESPNKTWVGAWAEMVHSETKGDRLMQQLAPILQQAELLAPGEKLPPYQPLRLDSNGDPKDDPAAGRTFAKVHGDIETLSLAALGRYSKLADERVNAGQSVLSWSFDTIEKASQIAGQAVVKPWILPESPGGVALEPGLEMDDDIGRPDRIILEEEGLLLVSSTGKYLLAGVDPQSFATILRTVALGEIPFITIGSEPSDREGFAKVTYAPSLRDTLEGALLYRADVQFKAVFADYPCGTDYALNQTKDSLLSGYPGPGGEFSRMWITSSGIHMQVRDNRLIAVNHGMRILSETTLQGDVRPDPAFEAYTSRLSTHWDEIAARLPEFQAIAELARETALAFWVRRNRIHVDEIIWTIPPRYDTTPDYAPIVAGLKPGQPARITGGVALTPEEKSRAVGRQLLFHIALLMDEKDQQSGLLSNRLIFGGLAFLGSLIWFLGSSGLVWLILKLALRGTGQHLPFRRVCLFWALLLFWEALVLMLLAPLTVGGWLGAFDGDLLALLVTLGAAPVLAFYLLRKRNAYLADAHVHLTEHPFLRRFFFAAALLVPLISSFLCVDLAILTVAGFGPIATPRMEKILTLELAPFQTLSSALGDYNPAQDTYVPLLPRSLRQTMVEPFRRETQRDLSSEILIQNTGAPNAFFPFKKLERIGWPNEVPVAADVSHFSPDGRPPYETQDQPNPDEEPDEDD